MNKWKGLLKKEWAFMKWPVITLVFINIMLTVLEISPVVSGVVDRNMIEILTSGNTWFNLNLYMGVFLLLVSLMNDMKRADIWLHSSASIMQLVGAKILFAGLVVTCSLVLCGIVIGVSGGANSSATEVLAFMATITMLILNTVYVIIVAFFIWSVYQVLRSRIGSLAIVVTFVFWVVGMFIWTVVWFKPWFQEIKEMGPILELGPMTTGLPYLRETNLMLAGLMPESALMTVGSLLLYIGFSLGLFIGGATLFERKVRL